MSGERICNQEAAFPTKIVSFDIQTEEVKTIYQPKRANSMILLFSNNNKVYYFKNVPGLASYAIIDILYELDLTTYKIDKYNTKSSNHTSLSIVKFSGSTSSKYNNYLVNSSGSIRLNQSIFDNTKDSTRYRGTEDEISNKVQAFGVNTFEEVGGIPPLNNSNIGNVRNNSISTIGGILGGIISIRAVVLFVSYKHKSKKRPSSYTIDHIVIDPINC
ncbi:hypothetical protein K502DRAFT_366490 [Neoconidiobolus thromboides FSU 785]|nr:hypothetical protein K502DRAFT_366490 [Neoconidiobolus thromboides FSU 785]